MSELVDNFLRYRDRGCVDGLGKVFDATVGRLTSLALMLCGNPADAEDAVQATFLVAIRKAAAFDAQRPLLPWLCGILEGEASNLRRHRRAQRCEELPELLAGEVGPLATSERRELVAALRTNVDRLPADQRQVLLLQLQHGLQAIEVAEVLGVSPGAVRMRIHRGLAALRQWLPASLALLLGAVLPVRGAAAMRAMVLGAGAHEAATVVGGMMAKKMLLACSVLILAVIGLGVFVPWRATNAASLAPPAPAPLQTASIAKEPIAADAAVASVLPRRDVAATERVAVAPGQPAIAAGGVLALHVVTYETNRPVPRATALLVPAHADEEDLAARRAITTDASGIASITGLAPGDYRIAVHCGGSRDVKIAANATTTVEVDVMTGNPARGLVVLPDGRPAVGAQIVLRSEGDEFDGGIADANGRFDLPAVYPFFRVGARMRGLAPTGLHELDPERELRLEFPGPAAVVLGTVVDTAGRIVTGATVQLQSEAPPERWQDAQALPVFRNGDALATADATGSFRCDSLPGPLRIRARIAGFEPFERVVEVAPGDNPVRVELERCAPLRGRVVDEAGAPIADVDVAMAGVMGMHRTTGGDGTFAFATVPTGAIELRCEAPAIEPLTAERAADASGEWRITARRRARYPLRFVDDLGVPLARWSVRCTTLEAADEVTDAEGRVRLIAPSGDRGRIEVRSKMIRMRVDWPAAAAADGETTVVVPRSAAKLGSVRGRVADASGAPITDARVSLRAVGGGASAVDFVADGSFHFDIVPGDLTLVVECGDGTPAVPFALRDLHAGEERDLGELRLPPRGNVSLRAVLPGGGVPTDVNVFFDASPEDGVPWFSAEPHAWPVGHHEFRLEASNAVAVRGAFDVRAGELTVVDLVLTPASLQRVRFPAPMPQWGSPDHVDWELFAPDGTCVASGTRSSAAGLLVEREVAMCPGDWRVRLRLPDGRTYGGQCHLAEAGSHPAPLEFPVTLR